MTKKFFIAVDDLVKYITSAKTNEEIVKMVPEYLRNNVSDITEKIKNDIQEATLPKYEFEVDVTEFEIKEEKKTAAKSPSDNNFNGAPSQSAEDVANQTSKEI